MKLLLTVSLTVSICLNVLLAKIVYSEHQKNQRVSLRLQESFQAITNAQSSAEDKQQVIELLEGKLSQIASVLSNSTVRLRVAEGTIRGYELVAEESRKKDEDNNRLLAGVPPPVITVEIGAGGREQKSFTFARLLDRAGSALASNATFTSPSGQYGRRLLFHSPDVPAGAVMFDVDELHPAVLHYISIDADEAKAKQARIPPSPGPCLQLTTKSAYCQEQ